MTRCDVDPFAFEDLLVDGRRTDAEGSRFTEQDLADRLLPRRRHQHADGDRRPPFLHHDRRQPSILSSGREQSLEDVGVELGVQVVEVRFQDQFGPGRSGGGQDGRIPVLLPDQHTEHVGEVQPRAAGSVADLFHAHARQLAEPFHERREDRRAGGRDQFHGHVARIHGRAPEQLHNGRRGDRQRPVLALHHAESGRHRRCKHPVDAERRQREGGSHDVDDRIHGANLMERHLLELATMHHRLRFGEASEDPMGHRLRVERHLCQIEKRPDARVRSDQADGRGPDAHLGRAQPAALDLLDVQVERLDRPAHEAGSDGLQVGPGVDQRAEGDVSGDPGDAVEVEDPHPSSARIAARTIRCATCAAPNPLSMFTTATPGAQEESIERGAESPPNEAP